MGKITEIELNGRKYVDKEELRALIREHKKKTKEGTEPGFIEEDSEKRIAAYMALNHLGAALTTDEEREAAVQRIMNSPKIIVHFDEKGEASFFRMWCKNSPMVKELGLKDGDSVPVFSTEQEDALVFVDAGMAKKQIEKITEMFPKFGKRLHALGTGQMNCKEWRNLFRLLYSGPDDEEIKNDEEE